MPGHPPKLLDPVRGALHRKRCSLRTAAASIARVRRLSRFHHLRHSCEMGSGSTGVFLTRLASRRGACRFDQEGPVARRPPPEGAGRWPPGDAVAFVARLVRSFLRCGGGVYLQVIQERRACFTHARTLCPQLWPIAGRPRQRCCTGLWPAPMGRAAAMAPSRYSRA